MTRMEYKMIKPIKYQSNLFVSSIMCLLALIMFQACEPGPQKINFSITAVDTNNLPVSGVYIYLSSYEAAWERLMRTVVSKVNQLLK